MIDIESGATLQQRNDGYRTIVGFIEVSVGGPIPDEVFTWTGDAISLADQRRAELAQWQADRDAEHLTMQQWFTEHIADPAITIPIQTDLSIRTFRELNETDGSFYAEIGKDLGSGTSGGLARRPRSDSEWDLGVNTVIRRWSTSEFDWTAWLFEATLDPGALNSLQRHLHPNEPASNEFTQDHSARGHR